jgi:histone-arginine methyltransferase CARM1
LTIIFLPLFALCVHAQVCHCKVEELKLSDDERVDVLVSEPMGTLLVNERMLETYLYARDHFLKPGGKMFPVRGG